MPSVYMPQWIASLWGGGGVCWITIRTEPGILDLPENMLLSCDYIHKTQIPSINTMAHRIQCICQTVETVKYKFYQQYNHSLLGQNALLTSWSWSVNIPLSYHHTKDSPTSLQLNLIETASKCKFSLLLIIQYKFLSN